MTRRTVWHDGGVYDDGNATLGIQPSDGDLTAIAALSPTNDDIIQRKSGAWTNRSLAQIVTDLAGSLVTSIAKSGSSALHGAVTLSAGTNVTLTQSGNDISIAASASGGSGAVEYDYVEITSVVTVTATSDGNSGATAVINGNSVSYDGSTRIKIEFYCPYLIYNVSGQNILVNLYDGTTDLGRICNFSVSSSAFAMSLSGSRFLTPSSGSHSYNIRAWKTSASGTAQVGAGAAGASAYVPAYLRITKA